MTESAEEARSGNPTIVREVRIGDAIFALTEQNAIFRNGRQMVIPHVGVDFLPELMAALTTDEFVTGIVDNLNRENAARLVAPVDCGAYHEGQSVACEKPRGHEGPHSAFMGAPADWGGGDDFEWHDHPVEENPLANRCGAIDEERLAVCLLEDGHEGPHKESGGAEHTWPNHQVKTVPSRVDTGTNWEGFEVDHIAGDLAQIHHMSSLARIAIVDRAHAERILNSGVDPEYHRLCARAYLAWDDTRVKPEPEPNFNWNGFDIVPMPTGDHPNAAQVFHVSEPAEWLHFRGVEDADMEQNNHFATLCARAYIAWWNHEVEDEA